VIERNFDVPFVAEVAMREKQIQQNYRPIIGVHKWFARRPGTLFRSLLLAEFVEGDLSQEFFRSHDLQGKVIVDPFMGGGTPLIEANRIGCDVVGLDVNPMACWIVQREIEYLNLSNYRSAAHEIRETLDGQVGRYYRTRCLVCGNSEAHVKYFIWVKTRTCDACGGQFDLFPGYVLAQARRHPRTVLICSSCGQLNEVEDETDPGACAACGASMQVAGPARRNKCPCPHCGFVNSYSDESGPPRHRMVAIEYICPNCKPSHVGRFFKTPDAEDLERYESVSHAWNSLDPMFVPNEQIPLGDETRRLLQWGYRRYSELFNDRQLLGLELSCRLISAITDDRVRNALATNLSDLLRYQNMLCRYDTMALKSLDVFSVHGFPVGLIQCESNILGITDAIGGTSIGSGGWSNIINKYIKAKEYCYEPFEVKSDGKRKTTVRIDGEWIGDAVPDTLGTILDAPRARSVDIRCATSTECSLVPGSVDAVFTDPPYYSNVQYAELMDFCYVWLRRLARDDGTFHGTSTRRHGDLTGNATLNRGIEEFTDGLSAVFCKMTEALRPGAPLVFTYHHNHLEAYYPVAVAILDCGLVCTASLPCPAEMEASIHISGTGSSIVDTIFVCRSAGSALDQPFPISADDVRNAVATDVELLRKARLKPTAGDIRCIAFGHFVRSWVSVLRDSWSSRDTTARKLGVLEQLGNAVGGAGGIEALVAPIVRGETGM
jgi:putative DNA methylase